MTPLPFAFLLAVLQLDDLSYLTIPSFPTHTHRKSGTVQGKGQVSKKGGGGKYNWGDDLDNVDEIIDEIHHEG